MDRLLDRIREGLAGAARPPHPGPSPVRGAADAETLAARFEAALGRVAGRLVRIPDLAGADASIEREFPGRRIVRHRDRPTERDLRAAEVGVDRADLLLAETGTVLRSYPTREESRISLVPEISVFTATLADLVPDLPAALERVAPLHRAGRAYTVLVTGPSRTADIEKELVIPAHGPRELVLFLAEC